MNKIFLFVVLGLIVIFFVVTIIFSSLNQNPNDNKITPSPTQILETSRDLRKEKLKIIGASHSREEFYHLAITSPFKLTFNKPLDPLSIDFEILPKVEIETELDSSQTKLIFKPADSWEPNIIYSLNIKTAKGQDNSSLNSTYQINFRSESKNDEENSSYVEIFNRQ